MATPSYVAGSAAGTQSTSLSIAVPGSAQVGQLALLWMVSASADQPGSVPAGWSQIGSDVTIASGGTTKDPFVRLMYKVLAAGDIGANVVIPFSGQNKWSAVIAVYADVDTANPIHVSAFRRETVAGTTHTTPTPTVAEAGCLAVYGTSERGTVSTDFTAGTGMTERQQNLGAGGAGNGAASIADSAGSVATGALTARTWTHTASTDNVVTFAVALKPAASETTAAVTRIPGQLTKVALDAVLALGTPKAMLLTDAYTFDEDNHVYWSHISAHEVATGAGYTQGGQNLTSVTTVYDSGLNRTKFTSNPVTWTQGVGQTLLAGNCAIIVWTGNAATSPILAIVDAGGEVTAEGAIVVSPDAVEGWLTGAQVTI